MQYQRDSNIYKAVNISGPTHNLLGLEFAAEKTDVKVEQLKLEGDAIARVTADDVCVQVSEGLTRANLEFNLQLYVSRIQFVASDTPTGTIYKDMAYRIARRRHMSDAAYNGSDT